MLLREKRLLIISYFIVFSLTFIEEVSGVNFVSVHFLQIFHSIKCNHEWIKVHVIIFVKNNTMFWKIAENMWGAPVIVWNFVLWTCTKHDISFCLISFTYQTGMAISQLQDLLCHYWQENLE